MGATYVYGAQNRLTTAIVNGVTTEFTYDSRNRVVRRTSGNGTLNLTYSGWNLIEEWNGGGELEQVYAHGAGIDDHRRLGSLGGDCRRQPVGRDEQERASQLLSQVGLYDYRNRVYSAELGRFLQTDPIRFSAGDVNLYRYVGNEPVNFSDAYGLVRCDSGADLGKRKNLEYSASFTPGGSSPSDEMLKRALDQSMKMPVAGVTTSFFVGLQQLVSSPGAYVRLWIKGNYLECVCDGGEYTWAQVSVGPTNLGDYFLNHPEDQQIMVGAINQWVAAIGAIN